MLSVYQAFYCGLFALSVLRLEMPAKNDLEKMALTLPYSECYNNCLVLMQSSAIIYPNVLKSSLHSCLSQLSFHIVPYNQLSGQLKLQLSDKWVAGWMWVNLGTSLRGREERLPYPKCC